MLETDNNPWISLNNCLLLLPFFEVFAYIAILLSHELIILDENIKRRNILSLIQCFSSSIWKLTKQKHMKYKVGFPLKQREVIDSSIVVIKRMIYYLSIFSVHYRTRYYICFLLKRYLIWEWLWIHVFGVNLSSEQHI